MLLLLQAEHLEFNKKSENRRGNTPNHFVKQALPHTQTKDIVEEKRKLQADILMNVNAKILNEI